MNLDMNKETAKTIASCTSIVGVVAIVIYAVSQGHDGLLIGGGCAVVSGIGGYRVKALTTKQ